MAVFEPDPFENEKTRLNPPGSGDALWNTLTLGAVILMAAMLGWFGWVFIDPYTAANPFPPPTPPALLVFPSPTPTLNQLPPTWTPAVAPTTPAPAVPIPTATEAPPELEVAPTAAPEARPAYPFALKSNPAPIDASILYPDRGCNWMGVGGQVLDLQGRPVTGISVQFGGTLNGKVVDQMGLTGTVLKYGEAGFEFTITDSQGPLATTQNFWVRLVDQQRLPLSDRVYFDTYAECDKNLTIINFKQVR